MKHRHARSALALLACAGVASPAVPVRAQPVAIIRIYNNYFNPEQATVTPGGRIVWIAMESGHTVTADDGRFSWTLQRNEIAVWDTAGPEVVPYRCLVHEPRMRGSIVVGAAPVGTEPPEGAGKRDRTKEGSGLGA